jgi:tRNA threonylcarbamoyladenosine biosynthesis protein TsaB
MNILAFDTCLGACSVSVGLDAGGALEKIEAIYEEMATGQAERLIPMIDTAMRAARLGFSGLDRIAVTIGPGTFTGTRIGVAAARALALATGAGVVGVSTLEVMAEEARRALGKSISRRRLAVTVDAHRGQVYAQVFEDGGAAWSPELLTLAQAAALAESVPAVFVGTGAEAVAAIAVNQGFDAEAALTALQPNAAFLLFAAQDRDPMTSSVRPLYLRPADAKPQVAKSLTRMPP